MFDRAAAILELLRPRSLAATRKTLGDLLAEVRDLKRTHLETTRELQQQLAALTVRESQLRAVMRTDVEQKEARRRLRTVLDLPRIVSHVQRSVAAAELRLDPFPHCVVSRVLPEDFYDALLEGIPPEELFGDRSFNKQHLTVPFAVAPRYSRRVWAYMAQVVLKEALQPALVEKFRVPLAEWISANWPDLAPDPLGPPMDFKVSDGRILLRGRGYVIPPHRDPKWGFLTTILYLAGPKDSEAWGTQLFSVGDDPEAKGAAPHWIDVGACRGRVDVPFRRNTALVFLNSIGAHGAHIPEDAKPDNLRRYVYQFRIGPSPASMRALVELLPSERRALWAGKIAEV